MNKQTMELELKHIAPYLPYGLHGEVRDYTQSFYDGTEIWYNQKLTGIDLQDGILTFTDAEHVYLRSQDESDFKPVLRPLSDLTKEIEYNGKIINPSIELSKIAVNAYNDNMDNSFQISDNGFVVVKTPWFKKVHIYYQGKSITVRCYSTEWETIEESFNNSYLFYKKLFELHFDVFGLIDQGLAIDINTLENG